LNHRDAKDYVSPPYNLDQPPAYYVLGGIIFQELSRQYLKEWGLNWQREAPQRLVYLDHFQSELFPDRNRRVVILSQVLPANSTIGYDELSYLTVTQVNDQEIKYLDALAEAVKHPIEGFIKVQTEEDPKQIELDAAQVAAEAQDLQENYGISAVRRRYRKLRRGRFFCQAHPGRRSRAVLLATALRRPQRKEIRTPPRKPTIPKSRDAKRQNGGGHC